MQEGLLDQVIVYRRDTPTFRWDLTDEDGNPFDLTGYTGKLSCKGHPDDPDSAMLFNLDVTLDVTNHLGIVTLPPIPVPMFGTYMAEFRLLNVSPALEITVHQFELIVRKDVL